MHSSCCGAHCVYTGSLYNTLTAVPSLPVVQTYLGDSKSYDVIMPSSQDLAACATLPVKCVIHSKLVTNIAIHNCKSKHIIERELTVANSLPGATVVMHIGNIKQEGSCELVAQRINSFQHLLPLHDRKLQLEISAGKGNDIGWTSQHFSKIWEGLDRGNGVGICFDTQHGFASGMTPLQTTENVDHSMSVFQEITGRYPDIIHLNDSKVSFGSRVDRHEAIGYGHIWPRYSSESYFGRTNLGLVRLKQYADTYYIPVVSESPHPLQDVELWNSISYLTK